MTGPVGKLALDGGTPVRREPLLPGWPGGLLIGEEEKRQVLEVLESQSLYRHYGPHPRHKTVELEQGFAHAVGARHALAVTSGTAALIVGLAALGVGPGDEVIVPTYTWSDEILKRAIHLDLHPLLTEGDVNDISEAMHKVAEAIL